MRIVEVMMKLMKLDEVYVGIQDRRIFLNNFLLGE